MKLNLFFYLLLVAKTAYATDFSQKRGITNGEAQLLLDYHNYYRTLQGLGSIPGQSAAADMTALEWDDLMESNAQDWANQCASGMHGGGFQQRGEGQNYKGDPQGNVDKVESAFDGWVENEYQYYSYQANNVRDGRVGHYTQIVSAYSRQLGCGYNLCTGYQYARLICHFYPGGNYHKVHPFTSGPACSKCPSGHNYCMGGALCVRKDMCDGSKSECKCIVEKSKCESNGGTYDESNCQCKCAEGWTGANCDLKCENKQDDCQWLTFSECAVPSNYLTFYTQMCKKFCKQCNLIILKKKQNTRNIKVNAFKLKSQFLDVDGGKEEPVQPGTTAIPGGKEEPVETETTPIPDANCKDDNANCPDWAANNECARNPGYMLVSCKKSCDQCTSGNTGEKPDTNSDPNCKDDNTNCPDWASAGECSKNPGYMLVSCKKSCNKCTSGTNCKDTGSACSDWKSANPGLCDTYLKHYCQATCGNC